MCCDKCKYYMTSEEAIKTLRELWRETNDPWYKEVYNMAIEALQNKWTPVSEGLPKKEGEYIVSMGNDAFNTEGRVTWANYDIHKNQFYLPGGNVNYYINVSAWRPFPKPYKK